MMAILIIVGFIATIGIGEVAIRVDNNKLGWILTIVSAIILIITLYFMLMRGHEAYGA